MNQPWKVNEVPVLALAFIGDAVWHVYVRDHVLSLGKRRPNDLHRASTHYARAEGQARAASILMDELTLEEQSVVRRGRNAKSGRMAKHAEVLEYRHSTGFEALIGFLHGQGQVERLDYICKRALAILDEESDGQHAKN